MSDLYKGEIGAAYFTNRAAFRSPDTQRRRASFFRDLTRDDLVTVDFGCGTGGGLASLRAKERIGVEVGPEAAAEAAAVLDRVYNSLSEVATASVDLLISFHALEHVADPFAAMSEMARVLKPGARFRLVVPFESARPAYALSRWHAKDATMHLFSWVPQTFGNLLAAAGLEIDRCAVAPFAVSERFPALAWVKGLSRQHLQVVATGHRPSQAPTAVL